MRYVLMACVLLAGCAQIREARQARDADACTRYGFTPGTDGYANCLMQRDNTRRSGPAGCNVVGTTMVCY